METIGDVAMVRGERELFDRTAHLFASATEVACAAKDLNTWATTRPRAEVTDQVAHHGAEGKRIRHSRSTGPISGDLLCCLA